MRTFLNVVATFAVALLLGIGSAWFMIEHGSPLTTGRIGPWASWVSEGNPVSDPYTKAHLARSGRLPLTSTIARYFVANSDSEGRRLTSACDYSIEGSAINARWWSLAVYDNHGSLIDNPSKRFSFNSEEAIRHSDGTYRINLARSARPENWLPSGDGPERNLVLMLRVYGPRETDAFGTGRVPEERLPKIERQTCE
jgi:hypothetical protein